MPRNIEEWFWRPPSYCWKWSSLLYAVFCGCSALDKKNIQSECLLSSRLVNFKFSNCTNIPNISRSEVLHTYTAPADSTCWLTSYSEFAPLFYIEAALSTVDTRAQALTIPGFSAEYGTNWELCSLRGEKDCRSETIYYFILVVKVAFVTRQNVCETRWKLQYEWILC